MFTLSDTTHHHPGEPGASGGEDSGLEVLPFRVGPMDNRTYLITAPAGETLLIDPSFEIDRVAEHIRDEGLTVEKIINTHGHFDHIVGNAGAKRAFPDAPLVFPETDREFLDSLEQSAELYGFEAETSPEPDANLEELDSIAAGGFELDVIHTPGHSPGHHCLTCREEGFVIVADLIFRGSIGRTDLPGGDMDTLVESARNILENHPGDTVLYPGHGDPTTVERERNSNPFVGDDAVRAHRQQQ